MDERLVSDLGLLAAIRLAGMEPRRAMTDGRRVSWAFSESAELATVIEKYYAGRLVVDALSHSERIRAAKAEALQLRGGNQ